MCLSIDYYLLSAAPAGPTAVRGSVNIRFTYLFLICNFKTIRVYYRYDLCAYRRTPRRVYPYVGYAYGFLIILIGYC